MCIDVTIVTGISYVSYVCIFLTFCCHLFLGAFAKLRKAAISFVMSVRPSVFSNSAPTERIFMKIYIWGFFKICWKNWSYLNLDKTSITGTLPADRYTFLITSRSFSLRMRNVSHESRREIENTHYGFINFLFDNRAVYEKMCIFCRTRRPHVTIWCMRTAWWIPKATNTHLDYAILTAF
jgi:hypothetical protein